MRYPVALPPPPLSAAARQAISDLRGLLRAANDPALLPPAAIDTDEAAREWAGPVAAKVAALRAKTAAGLAAAQQGQQRVDAGGDGAWRLVDDAFLKLEAELAGSSALKVRLSEGRRSMAAKAERVVQECVSVDVHTTGGKGVAALSPAGVKRLKDELPLWIVGWSDYAQQAYEVDLHRLVDRLWSGREGELPVPRPRFAPLPQAAPPPPPDFPTITQQLDLDGFGGVLQRARGLLYGAMSVGVLFGLRPTGGAGGASPLVTAGMVAAGLAAVAYGFVQHRNEQAARIERFEGEVARRAEQAVKAVLTTWYDRQNDKLLEHFAGAMHDRRAALVRWYAVEVAPRKARAEADAADRRSAAEASRKQAVELERTLRELERAEAAFKALLGAA
jgi:hypothetical protein